MAKVSLTTNNFIQFSELVIGDNLGRGAYGRVYKVKCHGVFYAAKEIHTILLEYSTIQEQNAIVNSFVRECNLASQLSHPNIVQFQGISFRSGDIPIMLMELMDASLTSYIDSQLNISNTTKVSLLHDVSLGLRYLHERNPPVIHRDLSSNNVMLKSYLPYPVAKIGDLGVSKALQENNHITSRMTAAPGTTHFMPPEACQSNPVYGTPLDIFSFANVALHLINKIWPEPKSKTKYDPTTEKVLASTETERRDYLLHFKNGPFKQLILLCLSDNPRVRPSAAVIETFLSTFKDESALNVVKNLVQESTQVEETLTSQIKRMSRRIVERPLEIFEIPVAQKLHNDLHVSKWIYGNPQLGKPEKTIMVVGETGSGKSTLINAMVNHILGVKFEDKFRFKMITEQQKPETESQTQSITSYTLHNPYSTFLPYDITIVDTPGFGDTRGLARDKQITHHIKEFFNTKGHTGIDHLDAVCFFAKSSDARLSPTQQYIYQSVLSVFGKDVEENIYIMVTFCDENADDDDDDDDDSSDDENTNNLKVVDALRKSKVPCKAIYQFNNGALYSKNLKKRKPMWSLSHAAFQAFFDKLYTTQSVSLFLTKEVMENREQLQIIIQDLKQKISIGVIKVNQLERDKAILEEKEGKIKENEHFTYERKTIVRVQVDIQGTGKFVTNCTKCNYTCHYPCILAESAIKYNCGAMKNKGTENAYCAICPQQCSWKHHVNDGVKIEDKAHTETVTDEHLKKEYLTAKSEKDAMEVIVASVEMSIKSAHEDLIRNVEDIQQCLQRLDDIALNLYNLTEEDYIDLLIQQEENSMEEGYQLRIQIYEEAKQHIQLLKRARDHTISSGEQDSITHVAANLKQWKL